jgi:pyridoxal 5'-phosphate synthase pdxS subunit
MRAGLGRLERATTPGPDPAGEPSATDQRNLADMTVETSTWATKKGLAQMLKGGVIMDVVTPDQAKIAEDAGAVAVMALERVPADIRAGRRRRPHVRPGDDRRDHGRRHDPGDGEGPDRPFRRGAGARGARRRLHRRVEVLTPADEKNHIDKHAFKVPFVCGCRNLGEALRRISEGAAMMRTKGEAGPATSSRPSASCAT